MDAEMTAAMPDMNGGEAETVTSAENETVSEKAGSHADSPEANMNSALTGKTSAREMKPAGHENRIDGMNPQTASEDARLRAHFDDLRAQAEAMRRMYPGFDLEAELKDPAFFRWTAPEGGMTLRQAYMARHGDEMLTAAMRYAAERTREHTAANIRAGMARPTEGGLSGSGGVTVDRDIASMTRSERADIRQRAARGEKIVF